MLIEKSISKGDVVSFKLASGEEVVAKLDEVQETKYVVTKPLMLTMSEKGLALAPFMFTIEPLAKISFHTNNVLCASKTEKQMASQYIATTTGLAMPTQPSVTN
tara:strand:+ start:787 stop:1098 length:312 start_codon:yes stop_codon:yes gene_type:complete